MDEEQLLPHALTEDDADPANYSKHEATHHPLEDMYRLYQLPCISYTRIKHMFRVVIFWPNRHSAKLNLTK